MQQELKLGVREKRRRTRRVTWCAHVATPLRTPELIRSNRRLNTGRHSRRLKGRRGYTVCARSYLASNNLDHRQLRTAQHRQSLKEAQPPKNKPQCVTRNTGIARNTIFPRAQLDTSEASVKHQLIHQGSVNDSNPYMSQYSGQAELTILRLTQEG